jgi:2',3'-cyclic-nucleotide 2'-phosphodiesterase (5'-nucleotidase family)
MRLRILHTNDLHSRFENFSRVVTKINELRDENTVVLDAGDFNDFMRVELQGTKGEAGCRLLNMAGYDAISIGNNEGFSKIETIENMTGTNLVPFLSSNLYKKGLVPIKGVKKSILLERGGLRILIIGCTPPYNEFFVLDNMYAEEPYEAIQKEIDARRGEYDICILLNHEGIREDRELPYHVKGAQIIIGGHSHTFMEDAEVINDMIIHQSGCYGECLGVLDVEIEEGRIKGFSAQNINTRDVPQDEAILNEIARQKDIAIENLSITLYEINRDVWHDVCEENPISNLLADALRDVLKCDIGLINSGVINGGVRRGNLTQKKLLEIMDMLVTD